jgi:iron complex transport system substrate-binding protein
MSIRLIALLLVLGLVSCGGTEPTTLEPDSGPTASETTPADQEAVERVVALTSLSADILYRLDDTKLVGIPGSRLTQSDARFEGITTVSEGRTPPNVEKIAALEPDLVVGAAGFHEQVLAQLEGIGIRTIATEVNSWDSLEAMTQNLAALTATDSAPLLEEYQQLLPEAPSPDLSVLVLVGQQPILAPSAHSWAGDLLDLFQVQNLVAQMQGDSEFEGYVTLSPETILAEDPDLLLLVDDGQGSVEALKSKSFWQELKAVQDDRVYTFDYYGLINPGSIAQITEASQQLTTITQQEVTP